MTNNTDKRRNRRRVAAVLAGGLVVGVGTMATLASWNDAEFAKSSFASGSFNMQGSSNGTDWGDHLGTSGAPAATLDFSAPVTHMSPSDAVYAPFSVRLGEGSTYGADVKLSVADYSGTMGDALSYAVYQTADFGCSASTDLSAATTLVDSHTVQVENDVASFELAKPDAGQAGSASNLCVVVTAGSSLVQDTAGEITWQLYAASKNA